MFIKKMLQLCLAVVIMAMMTSTGFGMGETASSSTMSDWPFTVTLSVPHPGWQLSIDSVYEGEATIWVVARVTRPETGMFAQVITSRSQQIMMTAPKYPVQVIIIGKTWGWPGPDEYQFVDTKADIDPAITAFFTPNRHRLFKLIHLN